MKEFEIMPGFASLSDKDVTDLIAFMRSWAASAVTAATPTPTPTSAPVSSGDAANGAQVYALYCAGCHGPDGQGSPVAKKPLHAAEYLAGVTDDALRQVMLKGVTGMPGFAGIIADKDVTDLIALFRSWQR